MNIDLKSKIYGNQFTAESNLEKKLPRCALRHAVRTCYAVCAEFFSSSASASIDFCVYLII